MYNSINRWILILSLTVSCIFTYGDTNSTFALNTVIDTNIHGSCHPVIKTFAVHPLWFEVNQGQASSGIKFLSKGQGYTLYLTPSDIILQLRNKLNQQHAPLVNNVSAQFPVSSSKDSESIHIKFKGVNSAVKTTGEGLLPGTVNHFKGRYQADWYTNISTYSKVRCRDIYPGIDLVYYGRNQKLLEWDLIVAPGADPGQIIFDIEGSDQVQLDKWGDLIIHAGEGQVRLYKPSIYQMKDGERNKIMGRYRIIANPGNSESTCNNCQIAFELDNYDQDRILVIDPVLNYSTYLGGSGSDCANGIAVDTSGNVYVTGYTLSTNFPTINPLQPGNSSQSNEVFVSKLDQNGVMVYSTYLGGSADDVANSITVDSEGNAYVTGVTSSSDFPVKNPIYLYKGGEDVFVVKLNSTGSALSYSTFIGGNQGYQNESGRSIAVDSEGNAYITGRTLSPDFPVTDNVPQSAYGGDDSTMNYVGDAFVTKLNSAGSALVYATFLGGSKPDSGAGIAVDDEGNVYVAGSTRSSDFPTTATAFQPQFGGGYADFFVTKLNAQGSTVIYSTFLGGSDQDRGDLHYGGGTCIAVDKIGNAYVTGQTMSDDFPVKNSFQSIRRNSNAFVTKFNTHGSDIVYSTYLGERAEASGSGIAVDPAGYAYVTGLAGDMFPVVNPIQSSHGNLVWPFYDAFVSKLEPDGFSLVYSTYIGGNGGDWGNAIAVDALGNAYIAGTTFSTNFPTINACQMLYHGAPPDSQTGDAFVAKFSADHDHLPPIILYAVTCEDYNEVDVVFSEPVEELSATNPGNYTINKGVKVLGASIDSNSKTVRLTITPLVATEDYTLNINNIQDRALPIPNIVTANSKFLINSLIPGVATRKVFKDISGFLLYDLTGHVNFPSLPAVVDYVNSLETPPDVMDNYGVLLQGFVIPPMSGDYVFYMCSDDQGALYLSTDDNPANKQLIASEPQWNGSRQWINGSNQASRGDPPANRSTPIYLEAERKYYIEAIMKEAGGGDNLGVTWRLPQAEPPTNGAEPIQGQYLLSYRSLGRPNISLAPRDQTVSEGGSVTFEATWEGRPPFDIQWFKDGVAIPGSNSPHLTLSMVSLTDNDSIITVQVTNAHGQVTSQSAVLTVYADVTPPTLIEAKAITLEQVAVDFSEPLDKASAEIVANYTIYNNGNSLLVSKAEHIEELNTVVLTTSRMNEGITYTITVKGIRDTSATGNEIALNSSTSFTPYFENEFIGPFTSWADAKRDYGAIGDGITDDTDALQLALNNTYCSVLFLPAGTYRITGTLQFVARISASVFGDDPATTIIRWDGPQDGVMLWCNGIALSRVGRLTFDGMNKALSAIDLRGDGAGGGGCTSSGIEYADIFFKDLQFGIRGGNPEFQANDAEIAVQRCRFFNCSKAGISLESFNALNWWIWRCLFEDCRLGVCTVYGVAAGGFHVRESIFRRSTESDMGIGNTSGYLYIRGNHSVGSRAFLRADSFTGNHNPTTVQGNIILDPYDIPINIKNLGPLLLIDNVIRTRPGYSYPVAHIGHDTNWTGDMVSIGNIYTVPNPLSVIGRQYSQDDIIVDRDKINPQEPNLPGPLPNLRRPIIEVSSGSDAVVIQQLINEAGQLKGQRPIVHLPAGGYNIDRTLVIPTNSDLQIVGDGYSYADRLVWTGNPDEAILRLKGPSHATLRDISVGTWWGKPHLGIVIEDCDQVGSRVFGEQVRLQQFLVDRLDHTLVELRNFNPGSQADNPPAVRVIGGPDTVDGQLTEARVNIFGGSSGGDGPMYEVQNGGRLLVRGMYFEGPSPYFLRLVGSGTFTLHGAIVAFYNPMPNPSITLENFQGRASFITSSFSSSNLRVLEDGEETQLIGLGLVGNLPDYFVSDSNDAQVYLIGSRTSLDMAHQAAIPDYSNNIDVAEEFFRQMLSQTRSENPLPLTPLSEDLTDIRLYGVEGDIHIHRDNRVTIITQPKSQIIEELKPVAFNIYVAGPEPHHIQWFKNDLLIPDANDYTYTIPSVTLSDDGSIFTAVVSNSESVITSSEAVLNVLADLTSPQIIWLAGYDSSSIQVHFDEPIEIGSANNVSNYAVNDGTEVLNASLRIDGKSVLLQTSQRVHNVFDLTIRNITDLAANQNIVDLTATGFIYEMTSLDIGNPNDPFEPGSMQILSDGTIQIIAGGSDIWNMVDGFHFCYQPRYGDFDLQVKISHLDPINCWSKAGLMARESLDSNSRNVSIVATPVGPTVDGQWSGQGADMFLLTSRLYTGNRSTTSGYSSGINYPRAWIRLRRKGDVFTAYRLRQNEESWEQIGQVSFEGAKPPLPGLLYVGLAATSGNNDPEMTTVAHFNDFDESSNNQ